jgi:hypothetical protein
MRYTFKFNFNLLRFSSKSSISETMDKTSKTGVFFSGISYLIDFKIIFLKEIVVSEVETLKIYEHSQNLKS